MYKTRPRNLQCIQGGGPRREALFASCPRKYCCDSVNDDQATEINVLESIIAGRLHIGYRSRLKISPALVLETHFAENISSWG